MNGLDCLGTDEVGVDFVKMLPGLLSGAGDVVSSFGPKKDDTAAQDALRRAAEREKAESTARKWKWGLGLGGGAVVLTTIAVLLARR